MIFMSTNWTSDFLFDSKDSDVKLRIEAVNNGKQLIFPAHSLVLKRASNVFRTMLEERKLNESVTGPIVDLRIPGNENDAMALYTYIYKQDLPELSIRSYLALLQAGKLYEISPLVSLCEGRTKLKISPFSVCEIAEFVKNLSEDLFRFCQQLMLRSAFLIFDSNLHLCLSQDIMQYLLKSDNLNVLDEDQVVEAAWKWEKATFCTQIDKTESLQKKNSLLDLIRWNLVKNKNEAIPWFKANEDVAVKVNTASRNPNSMPSLLQFSQKCVVKENVESEIFVDLARQNLAHFCVNRKILVSGLLIQAASVSRTMNRPFNILINDKHVTLIGNPKVKTSAKIPIAVIFGSCFDSSSLRL